MNKKMLPLFLGFSSSIKRTLPQIGRAMSVVLFCLSLLWQIHFLAPTAQAKKADIDPTEPITDETFEALNPLIIGESDKVEELSTPGGIVSNFLTFYAFPIAGLILFVMLLWGGFEMLSGAAAKKNLDAGKQRVTSALIGFLILFMAYWLAQILEIVFDINILGR